jgi:hypothetical protein
LKGRSVLGALVCLFGGLAALVSPVATAQPNSAGVEARLATSIVAAVSVSKSQDLVLGEFRPGSAPGTVELNVGEAGVTASRTASGGVALAGSSFSAAEFSVTSHAGAPVHFSVVLPPGITLQRVGGGEVMRVDSFRSNVRSDCTAGVPVEKCPGSPYTLLVGATLHVAPGQTAGRYVGSFTVTVNQL